MEKLPSLSEKQVAHVIDQTGVTKVTKMLIFAASLGYLFDAFDNTLLGYVMPLIAKEYTITSEMKGFILSLALWGGVVGMWFWGPIAEMKGRRIAFQGTVLTFSLFTGLAAATWNALSLGITRFITGAGLMGFYAVDLAMVSEMTPTRLRGRLTSAITVLYPVGVVLGGFVAGLLAEKVGWRGMFLVGVIPALCAYIIRRHVPESPRWLVSKGRGAEAEKALVQMGATPGIIEEVKQAHPVETAAPASTDSSLKVKFSELFSRKWLRTNIVALVAWNSCSFAPWGVMLWLPTILVEVYHFSFVKSVMFSTITFSFGLLGRLCGVYLIEKIGRRPLLIMAFSMAAVFCLAFGLVTDPAWLLFFIAAYKFFNDQGSLGVMAYIPELYPTRLRVMGNSYAASSSRISAALAPIMVGFLMGMHQYTLIWIIFAVTYVIGALTIWLLASETKGKSLEEVTN